jgi:hypothetical protein
MWDVSAGSIAALTVLGITAVALSDIIGTAIAAHDRVARTRKAAKGDTGQMPDLPSRQLRHHARRVWRRTRMARGWPRSRDGRQHRVTQVSGIGPFKIPKNSGRYTLCRRHPAQFRARLACRPQSDPPA